ncbi:MAG: HisA/HisF-related TIM barrel protein, partial [Pseudomonadota bacterium]
LHRSTPFKQTQIQPVIGSETVLDDADIREMSLFLPQGCALSLDMRGERRLGPDVLFDHPELWPDEVIVMSLDRVGTSHGPDFGRLASVCDQAGGRAVFAAGGVRGFTDLAEIGALGCGALVSSVLHNGGLDRAQWDRLCDL